MNERKFIDIETSEQELDLDAPVGAHYQRVSQDEYREQFMEDQLQCVLCGDDLQFKHVTEFAHNTVCEEAFCRSCNLKTRSNKFQLQ